MADDDSLSLLLHEVNGKCSSLKSAAAMLTGKDSKDELELLGLMSRQARSLADAVSVYEARRRGERPK